MSTQKQSQLTIISQRYRQQIRQQFQLLQKGNSPTKLIGLVEEFELDPKSEAVDRQEIHYLIVGYIVDGAWLDVKHLSKRYALNDVYQNIVELAQHAVNEELTQFCTLFLKVTKKIKEIPQNNIIKLSNIDQILERAKLSFVMKVYSKYYVSLDVDTIKKTSGCKEGQIAELGYNVKDGFVQFGLQKQKPIQGSQQVLLQKMRNLVTVAQQMTTFE